MLYEIFKVNDEKIDKENLGMHILELEFPEYKSGRYNQVKLGQSPSYQSKLQTTYDIPKILRSEKMWEITSDLTVEQMISRIKQNLRVIEEEKELRDWCVYVELYVMMLSSLKRETFYEHEWTEIKGVLSRVCVLQRAMRLEKDNTRLLSRQENYDAIHDENEKYYKLLNDIKSLIIHGDVEQVTPQIVNELNSRWKNMYTFTVNQLMKVVSIHAPPVLLLEMYAVLSNTYECTIQMDTVEDVQEKTLTTETSQWAYIYFGLSSRKLTDETNESIPEIIQFSEETQIPIYFIL